MCNSKLSVLFLLPAVLFAQSYTASLRGVVTDVSGAAIPAARVVAISVERGTEFVSATDGQGRYTLTALPPGDYSLIAEAPGFKKLVRSAFNLQVQQQATMNLTMELGEVSTVVEVEASAPLLNTTIANLGQVIDTKTILQMPLLGRSPMALTYLTPGVVGSGGRMSQNNTNFVAAGARNSTADVMLDGVSVTNIEQNSGITQLKYTPSVDAVQEFKVQTNFFSAEYGNTGGAVVNMVTKSGTNEFHGTAYEFYRNSSLNANSFFNNRNGREQPDFRRHVFGGVVGGPIKKNKLFFFSTIERTDQQSGTSATLTVPTLQQRQGDFSDYRNASGRLIQIYNPFDTYTNARGEIKRRPFAGNVIPQSMMDPVALKALQFIPEPNQPGAAFTNRDNWYQTGVNANKSWQTDHKIDWNLTDIDRLTARYSHARSASDPANLFGNAANEFNTGPGVGRTHNAVGDYTRAHNATTVFTVRYGYLNQYGDRNPFQEFDVTTLGLPGYIRETADFHVFPRMDMDGYASLGSRGWLVVGRKESTQQLQGSVTKLIGGHNLKMGAEFRQFRMDYLQPGHPSSQYSFGAQVTREDRFAGSNVQGNGFASMLLGWGTGSAFHHDPWSFSRSQYYGFYVHDDWKITRKLTLNLGMRYDFDVPRWETENRYSYWNLDAPSPLNGQVPGLELRGHYEFVNDDVRSPFDGDYNNWQPRFGFAYALNDKTSIRSGFGLFFQPSRATIKGHLGSGFSSSSNVEWTRDANATRYATLSNPFPNGLNLPPGSSLGPMTFVGLGGSTVVRENRNPVYQNWNFSIQRQLPWDSVVEINYTGGKGTHLLMPDTSLSRLHPSYWSMGRTALNRKVTNPFHGVITDPKSALSQPTIEQHRLLRPMPQYLGASRGDGSEPGRGNSSIHSLQLRYEKRFSRGLSFLGHYTWSKMLDDVSHAAGNVNWLGGGTNIQDFYNLRNERGLSTHDVPHRAILSFNYQLPVGRGRWLGNNWGSVLNAIAGGWEVSGIATVQSGVPLNVTQNGGTLWDASQRPNLVGDPAAPGSVHDRLDQYFNEEAFTRPAPDTLGSAPRTLGYRAPGLMNLDMALLKSFAIREGMRGEFRFETFNTTNTPAFGAPNTSYGSTGFGRINGLMSGTGARNVQLGAKFYF